MRDLRRSFNSELHLALPKLFTEHDFPVNRLLPLVGWLAYGAEDGRLASGLGSVLGRFHVVLVDFLRVKLLGHLFLVRLHRLLDEELDVVLEVVVSVHDLVSGSVHFSSNDHVLVGVVHHGWRRALSRNCFGSLGSNRFEASR